MKKRKDENDFSEKYYELTMSEDSIEVVQVDRDTGNTFFSQIML